MRGQCIIDKISQQPKSEESFRQLQCLISKFAMTAVWNQILCLLLVSQSLNSSQTGGCVMEM